MPPIIRDEYEMEMYPMIPQPESTFEKKINEDNCAGVEVDIFEFATTSAQLPYLLRDERNDFSLSDITSSVAGNSHQSSERSLPFDSECTNEVADLIIKKDKSIKSPFSSSLGAPTLGHCVGFEVFTKTSKKKSPRNSRRSINVTSISSHSCSKSSTSKNTEFVCPRISEHSNTVDNDVDIDQPENVEPKLSYSIRNDEDAKDATIENSKGRLNSESLIQEKNTAQMTGRKSSCGQDVTFFNVLPGANNENAHNRGSIPLMENDLSLLLNNQINQFGEVTNKKIKSVSKDISKTCENVLAAVSESLIGPKYPSKNGQDFTNAMRDFLNSKKSREVEQQSDPSTRNKEYLGDGHIDREVHEFSTSRTLDNNVNEQPKETSETLQVLTPPPTGEAVLAKSRSPGFEDLSATPQNELVLAINHSGSSGIGNCPLSPSVTETNAVIESVGKHEDATVELSADKTANLDENQSISLKTIAPLSNISIHNEEDFIKLNSNSIVNNDLLLQSKDTSALITQSCMRIDYDKMCGNAGPLCHGDEISLVWNDKLNRFEKILKDSLLPALKDAAAISKDYKNKLSNITDVCVAPDCPSSNDLCVAANCIQNVTKFKANQKIEQNFAPSTENSSHLNQDNVGAEAGITSSCFKKENIDDTLNKSNTAAESSILSIQTKIALPLDHSPGFDVVLNTSSQNNEWDQNRNSLPPSHFTSLVGGNHKIEPSSLIQDASTAALVDKNTDIYANQPENAEPNSLYAIYSSYNIQNTASDSNNAGLPLKSANADNLVEPEGLQIDCRALCSCDEPLVNVLSSPGDIKKQPEKSASLPELLSLVWNDELNKFEEAPKVDASSSGTGGIRPTKAPKRDAEISSEGESILVDREEDKVFTLDHNDSFEIALSRSSEKDDVSLSSIKQRHNVALDLHPTIAHTKKKLQNNSKACSASFTVTNHLSTSSRPMDEFHQRISRVGASPSALLSPKSNTQVSNVPVVNSRNNDLNHFKAAYRHENYEMYPNQDIGLKKNVSMWNNSNEKVFRKTHNSHIDSGLNNNNMEVELNRLSKWISNFDPTSRRSSNSEDLRQSKTKLIHEINRGDWSWTAEWSPCGTKLAVGSENHGGIAIFEMCSDNHCNFTSVPKVLHDGYFDFAPCIQNVLDLTNGNKKFKRESTGINPGKKEEKKGAKDLTTGNPRAIAWTGGAHGVLDDRKWDEYIAIGGSGKSVHIVCPYSLQCVDVIPGTEFVGSLDWRPTSPDNVVEMDKNWRSYQILAIGNRNYQCLLFLVTTMVNLSSHARVVSHCQLQSIGFDDWVNAVKFSPLDGGHFLATANRTGKLSVYNRESVGLSVSSEQRQLQKYKKLKDFYFDGSLLCIEWDRNRQSFLYAGGEGFTVYIINTYTWEVVSSVQRSRWVQFLSSSTVGGYLAMGGGNEEVSILLPSCEGHVVQADSIQVIPYPHSNVVLFGAWQHPQSQKLMICGQNNSLHILETNNTRLPVNAIYQSPGFAEVHCVAISPDGAIIALGNSEGVVTLLSTHHSFLEVIYEVVLSGSISNNNFNGVRTLCWNIRGDMLACGGGDSVVLLGRYLQGQDKDCSRSRLQVLRVIRGLKGVEGLSFSPDGILLVVSGFETGLFHAGSQGYNFLQKIGGGVVLSSSWSLDGSMLGSIGRGESLIIYKLRKSKKSEHRESNSSNNLNGISNATVGRSADKDDDMPYLRSILEIPIDGTGHALSWGPSDNINLFQYLAYGSSNRTTTIVKIFISDKSFKSSDPQEKYNKESYSWTKMFCIKHKAPVYDLDWSSDGMLAIACGDGSASIFDLLHLVQGNPLSKTDNQSQFQGLTCVTKIQRKQNKNAMTSIQWLQPCIHSSSFLAVGGSDGIVELIDLRDWKCIDQTPTQICTIYDLMMTDRKKRYIESNN